MNDLGHAYWLLKRWSDAVQVFEKARIAVLKALPAADSLRLQIITNLAVNYGANGQLEDAASLWEKILAVKQDALGNDHPETLKIKANIAT